LLSLSKQTDKRKARESVMFDGGGVCRGGRGSRRRKSAECGELKVDGG